MMPTKIFKLASIHEQMLRVLRDQGATYAYPISSESLGETLNLTPSYVREQVRALQAMDVVGVRRGRGGGYFLRDHLVQVIPRFHRLASNQ